MSSMPDTRAALPKAEAEGASLRVGTPVADGSSVLPGLAEAVSEIVGDVVEDTQILGFAVFTDFANCLLPLLKALNWRGDRRHVAEALPHFADSFDLADLRNVMANLHFTSRPARIPLDQIDPRLLPCLFVPDMGGAKVVLEHDEDGLLVFEGSSGDYTRWPRQHLTGTAYFFTLIQGEDPVVFDPRLGWFRNVASRFTGLFYQGLGLTFLINLIALAPPIFVMMVYDRVIPSGSTATLAHLAIGIGIAVFFEVALRDIRVRLLSFLGGRIDNIFGNEIFKRILYLQPAYTERATIGAQVGRIKDFENIREFFTGPIAGMFIELPFLPVYIGVIAALTGMLAILPVIMLALFVALLFALMPLVRKGVKRSAQAGAKRQEFVVESLSKMQALKYTGTEQVWLDRYRKLSGEAAFADFHTAQITALVNTISSSLMMLSGLAVMSVGVFSVMSGKVSVGGLVAAMMLVWRVLAPLQTAFLTLSRLEQVRSSVRQIDTLMAIKPERNPNARFVPVQRVKGRVTFARVSLRYTPNAQPALMGVNFDIAPGEVVGIIGHNGSGKSTILKLLAGIYQPQAGSIRIDDTDIRQFDPIEIRYQMGYVPQVCNLFYGTIAQNMRLANPQASDDDLRWAAKMAAMLDDINALPEGFNTRIKSARGGSLPTSLQQRLSLARAFVKRSPILLFDEPGTGLDFEADLAFMEAVRQLKRSTTIFIVTHRPSHLKVADKVICMDQGNLILFGPPEQVMPKLPKNFL